MNADKLMYCPDTLRPWTQDAPGTHRHTDRQTDRQRQTPL